jgi:hypothetical protein
MNLLNTPILFIVTVIKANAYMDDSIYAISINEDCLLNNIPINGTVKHMIIFITSSSFHLFMLTFILFFNNSGSENQRGWTNILENIALGE